MHQHRKMSNVIKLSKKKNVVSQKQKLLNNNKGVCRHKFLEAAVLDVNKLWVNKKNKKTTNFFDWMCGFILIAVQKQINWGKFGAKFSVRFVTKRHPRLQKQNGYAIVLSAPCWIEINASQKRPKTYLRVFTFCGVDGGRVGRGKSRKPLVNTHIADSGRSMVDF